MKCQRSRASGVEFEVSKATILSYFVTFDWKMKVSEGFSMADSRNLPKVDYMMFLQHMRENDNFNVAEIRGAKVLMSSRDAYVETSVGYVEVKRENSRCFVKGRVTPEHRVRCKMYTVMAVINETEETIIEVKCEDCAASEGGCKHSICLIMWLIKRTEEPSVTSTSCYWTQPKLSEAVTKDKCILAKEMGKRKQVDVSLPASLDLPSVIEEFKKRKMSDSLIINYMSKTESLDNYSLYQIMLDFVINIHEDEHKDFEKLKLFAEGKLTSTIINAIEENTRSQADCILWHTMRQGRVSASKTYEATKCKTDGVLVKSILGGYKIPETKAITRGKKLEKEVVKEIEKAMNIKISQCGFVLITPFIGASPDGVCEDFTLEIKCPCSNKTMKNYINDNKISEKCKAQIQIQMHATGKKKALFCVADPSFESNKTYHQHWLYYDKLYVEKLLSEAEVFWKNYIFEKLMAIVKVK